MRSYPITWARRGIATARPDIAQLKMNSQESVMAGLLTLVGRASAARDIGVAARVSSALDVRSTNAGSSPDNIKRPRGRTTDQSRE